MKKKKREVCIGGLFPPWRIFPDWQEPEKPMAKRGPNGEKWTSCGQCDYKDCSAISMEKLWLKDNRHVRHVADGCPLPDWTEPPRRDCMSTGEPFEPTAEVKVRVDPAEWMKLKEKIERQRHNLSANRIRIQEQAAHIRELEDENEKLAALGRKRK